MFLCRKLTLVSSEFYKECPSQLGWIKGQDFWSLLIFTVGYRIYSFESLEVGLETPIDDNQRVGVSTPTERL